MATFHVDSYLDNISAKIERKTISTLVEHSLQSQSLNAEHKTSLEDSGKLRKLQKRDQLEDFKQNVQKLVKSVLMKVRFNDTLFNNAYLGLKNSCF